MIRPFSFAIATVLFVSCVADGPQSQDSKAGEYTLPLIETTDIHGHILSTDNNGTVHYGMAYIANKVKDVRGRGESYRKDKLLLLDGGDLYQGASVSNLLSGEPVFMCLDKMDYDAVALGNHEFDWGIENTVDADATVPDYVWEGKNCDNQVPVLCANLYQDDKRVTRTRDYVIVEKTAVNTKGETIPVKIGVVGFAVNYGSSIITTQFAGKGYSIKADYTIANNIAAELESSGACDATVLLAHGAADEVAAALGRSTVIDLVLGGHSHRTMSGKTEWGLHYLQGGRYCEHYASADLKFCMDQSGGISFGGVKNMSIKEVYSSDLDDDILAVSDYALQATAAQQNEVIGYINANATTYYLNGGGTRASVMGNWMCDILRRVGEADVSFVNAGGIRTSFPLNGQATREITVADVYEMFPFSNTTYVYRITYADLLKLFEYSMTSGGEALFSRMTGIDCYYTQTVYDTYSTYAVHSLRKDGTVIYQNKKWTDDWASRTLILAVSEYLAITERTDYYTGIPNPLIEWNGTDRLLSNHLVDNVSAVGVLRAESAASGGLLSIDTEPHFILN